jgi:hypothetical protein
MLPFKILGFIIQCSHNSRITVVTMTGAAIAIEGMSTADTILSVKQRVFAANPKLFVRRQRLVYSAGPRGMDALADDETLGGAGVARDGTAELDVLVADLTKAEAAKLGKEVHCTPFVFVQHALTSLIGSLSFCFPYLSINVVFSLCFHVWFSWHLIQPVVTRCDE